MITNETNNTFVTATFLTYMLDYLVQVHHVNMNNVVLVLDNAPQHSTKLIQTILLDYDLHKVIILPNACPSVSSVEVW